MFAYDFQASNGVCYNVTSSILPYTVEVTTNSNQYVDIRYSGDITIPSSVSNNGITYSVTSIGNSVFYYCPDLTSVTLPNTLTSIGGWAFTGCYKLTTVTIPSSVTSIGDWVFSDCNTLTTINVDVNNQFFASVNGILYNKDQSNVIRCPMNMTGIVNIPSTVTSICISAFYNCSNLTSIVLPNSVTTIGNHAFQYCSGLTSMTIPNSVTSIGDYSFWGCRGITSMNIPNSITSIGKYTFRFCSGLTSVILPNSLTSIGEGAFECSGLTSIIIPNSVTSISDSVFNECMKLKSVTLSKAL